jgi:hypothetical protein
MITKGAKMRKTLMIGALALAVAAPAFAGPKDQIKQAFIGADAIAGNAVVNNATTSFSMAVKGCTVQIKAKGLTGVTDGAIFMCVVGADVKAMGLPAGGAGNGVLLVGEFKKGGISLKADLSEIGCGGADQINYNGNAACYLDDAAYRGPTGSWTTACLGEAMAPIANAQPEPKKLKVNDTQNIVEGLCQGAAPGKRLPAPGSTLIAQWGARGFIE